MFISSSCNYNILAHLLPSMRFLSIHFLLVQWVSLFISSFCSSSMYFNFSLKRTSRLFIILLKPGFQSLYAFDSLEYPTSTSSFPFTSNLLPRLLFKVIAEAPNTLRKLTFSFLLDHNSMGVVLSVALDGHLFLRKTAVFTALPQRVVGSLLCSSMHLAISSIVSDLRVLPRHFVVVCISLTILF